MAKVTTYRQDQRRSGVVPEMDFLRAPEVAWHGKLTKRRKIFTGSGNIYALTDYPRVYAADHYMHFLFTHDLISGDQKVGRFADPEWLFASTSPSPCPLLVRKESVIYCRGYEIYEYDKELSSTPLQKSLKKPQERELLTTTPLLFQDKIIAAFTVQGYYWNRPNTKIEVVELSPEGELTTASIDLGATSLQAPLACDANSVYISGTRSLARLLFPLSSPPKVLWTFEYPNFLDDPFTDSGYLHPLGSPQIINPPVILDELVLLGVHGYEDIKEEERCTLIAIDKENGKKVWDLSVGSHLSSLCIGQKEIIFHNNKILAGCDPSTGENLFEIALLPNSWYSEPLIEVDQEKLVIIENQEGESTLVIYSLREKDRMGEVKVPGSGYAFLHGDTRSLVAGGINGDLLVIS